MIGKYHCGGCGGWQTLHPFDLLPGKAYGWAVTCEHCQKRGSLPFMPTAPAFLVGMLTFVAAWLHLLRLGEGMLGSPVPLIAYLLIVSAAGVAAMVAIAAVTRLYHLIFG